ncbi:hypothetical protein [Sphingomonas sp.]|uniref:hypothetical protein n=1 Tax=Sphingomonas sp. TaxID=28214 RepID=UPI0035B2BB8F
MASECGRDDVCEARQRWRVYRQPRLREQAHRLVFIDETATTTKMTRPRGRARNGQRLKAQASFGHWKTQTFVAGLRCDGLTAPWIIDPPMTRESSRSMSKPNSPRYSNPATSSSSTTCQPIKAKRPRAR